MAGAGEFLLSGWGAVAIAMASAILGAAASILFGWPIFRRQIAQSRALAVEQIEAARLLAEEQGTLRAPKLSGYLIHRELAERTILAVDFSPKRPFIIDFPIMVENHGDRSAKGVSVILRLPKIAGNFGVVTADQKQAAFAGVKMCVLGEESGLTVIAFSIPSVGVGHPVRLMLPVTLSHETFFEPKTKARTLDGDRLSVKSAVRYSYSFSLMISDEDGQTHSLSYQYELVRGQADEVRHYARRIGQAGAQREARVRSNDNSDGGAGTRVRISAAILKEHVRVNGAMGSKYAGGYDKFGFDGAWLVGGFETEDAMWFPPLDDGAAGPPA